MKKFLLSVPFKKICVFFLVSFFTLYIHNLFAQIKFSAVSSGKQIGKNEYFHVQYIVENAANVTRITPPSFKNFSIISGPNQQTGMSIINGVTKQYVSVSFILKPLSVGNFTIAPATAKAEGSQFRSNTLQVTVNNSSVTNGTAGTSIPPPFSNITLDDFPEYKAHEYDDYVLHKGENLQEKINKNIFVKADVNKTSCYVGEPIIATYKLFTRLKSESNLVKSPSFNGFSVSDLDKPDNYSLHPEKLNGREYKVYLLRKVQLYPLQPGTIELEPAEVENKITFIKAEYADARRGDIFYDMLRDFADASTPQEGIEEQTATSQSKPVTIMVKPLPEENKPDHFKGAVGNFKIDAAVDKEKITAEDVNNLKVVISGTGNFPMVNAPEIVWPEGMEAFESRSSEKIDNMSVPMKGIKIFTYPFTAQKPSSYNIPPVSFSYFDVNTKTYKSITSQPITVYIKKGNARKIINAFNQVYSKLPETIIEKIYKVKWFLILVIIVAPILLYWLIKRGKNKKAQQVLKIASINNNHENNIAAKTSIFQENPLELPGEKLAQNDSKLFYSSLDHSLRKYLSAKLKFPPEEFERKKINEVLDKYNIGLGTTLMLNSLLENIELNLYAPVSFSDQMQETYRKAAEVIALLDKQINYSSVNL